MKKWSNRSWIIRVLIFGIGVLGVGLIFHFKSNSAHSANYGTVTRGDLVQKVTIAGSVNPNRKTVITAPYNGYVRKIFVQIGQHVKEGDPIVSLAQSLKGSVEEIYPMRAPFSGTVVQVLKTEGEYVEQTNSQANGLVRIDDLSRMFVDANSPELEIGKLKEGQEGIVKASAILKYLRMVRIKLVRLGTGMAMDIGILPLILHQHYGVL